MLSPSEGSAWLSLQHDQPTDYIFASGIPHTVEDLLRAAFAHVGLEPDEYVRIDAEMTRAPERTLPVGDPSRARRDLAQMRELGINVARIYHLPPRWFLDCCAEAGIRVLITLPWAKPVNAVFSKLPRMARVTLRSAYENSVSNGAFTTRMNPASTTTSTP